MHSDAVPAVDVAAAVIRRGGLVLLARRAPGRAMAGLWEFPGGRVEPGETPAQALVRELREEMNVEASVGRQLHSETCSTDRGVFRILFLEVHGIEGEPALNDHDALEWVTPAAMADMPLAPADRGMAALLAS